MLIRFILKHSTDGTALAWLCWDNYMEVCHNAMKVSPFLEDNTMEYKNDLKKMMKHLDTILHKAFAKHNIDVESIKIPCDTFEQNVQTVISDVQQMLDIENADPTNYNKYEHIYWIKCIKTAISELIKMVTVLTEIDANFDELKTVEKIIKSAEILEKIRNLLLKQK
uniref:Uncharacterized protein n=1 Tax=Globodera rostochiensis TaxID=31243 RepID=A0A914HKS4_GLORO